MNKNEIGLNAGKVWQLLSDNEKWSYGALKRKSGLKDKELGAAIGWLAREDKIEMYQEEEELYISLGVNVYIG
ncbi:winged helix-turn-helix domain-containing protein [Bacteroides sp.]|uniref:winged helix-turn-helix domain-containing protein n=1 Tax=Bacteroides sp. TaxID=29523 RepID=UPI002634CF39|nr:winged helix-turn-helix domain-containing protein [Bacteroides sp.]